jgi:hypothetical protein
MCKIIAKKDGVHGWIIAPGNGKDEIHAHNDNLFRHEITHFRGSCTDLELQDEEGNVTSFWKWSGIEWVRVSIL